jgi:hypothetical protein
LPAPIQTDAAADRVECLHDLRLVRPPEDAEQPPWYVAALVSWGIALFEYLLQVPANRIGFASGITLAQLKIMQEVITLRCSCRSRCSSWTSRSRRLRLGRAVPGRGGVLHLPQADEPARTLRHIAIEGPIGVGKSSLARRWPRTSGAELLLERPSENPYLERFYDDPPRYALPDAARSSCSSACSRCRRCASPACSRAAS